MRKIKDFFALIAALILVAFGWLVVALLATAPYWITIGVGLLLYKWLIA